MKLIGVIFILVASLAGTAQAMQIDRPGLDTKATAKDYREVLRMLKGIEETLEELGGKARDKGWDDDCRGYSPEKTVRCAAEAFNTDADQALSVWRCESFFGHEPVEMGHSYHGPFQYLYSTYESQQEAMPDVVEWFELSPAVHDVRSNIMTAVAWGSKHGWGAWSCA